MAEGFAVAADGAEEDGEILDAAAERGADDQPERAGEIAELRGERGADERAGTSDGSKMVAEQNPFVGGYEVAAIIVANQTALSGSRRSKAMAASAPAPATAIASQIKIFAMRFTFGLEIHEPGAEFQFAEMRD